MMRQHSKVVHATSGDAALRAAKQERMASTVSVEWQPKRAQQNVILQDMNANTYQKPLPQVRKPSKELPKPNVAQTQATAQPKSNLKEAVSAPIPKKNASGEYGRLFIKVVKLKELELPLPKGIPLPMPC
jgi:hypothetical protein